MAKKVALATAENIHCYIHFPKLWMCLSLRSYCDPHGKRTRSNYTEAFMQSTRTMCCALWKHLNTYGFIQQYKISSSNWSANMETFHGKILYDFVKYYIVIFFSVSSLNLVKYFSSHTWLTHKCSIVLLGDQIQDALVYSVASPTQTWSSTIKVKQCTNGLDTFYVYRLKTPPADLMAYCAGNHFNCTCEEGYY